MKIFKVKLGDNQVEIYQDIDGKFIIPDSYRGLGTALKPSCEYWILVRKPLSEKTLAKNVLEYGTGAINIDASRVGNETISTHGGGDKYGGLKGNGNSGRFPANLVLSHSPDCELVGTKYVKPTNGSGKTGEGANGYRTTYVGGQKKGDGFVGSYVDENGGETVEAWNCVESCVVKQLDLQSGFSKSPGKVTRGSGGQHGKFSPIGRQENVNCPSDAGGASRFFYCAKASKSDRGEANTHPTVKNTKLMQYLITLITPPGGTVLDPFMGSGSTGVAALKSGFDFIGIEKEKEYFDISKERLESIETIKKKT